MANATTIRPEEAAHFGKLAAEWWDPKGSSAMLHRLNPVRLAFLRDAMDRHWHGDSRDRHPLAGKRALDVGCGAGLLCEPLTRLGAQVTGVDAAEENIAAARAHAQGAGLLSPLPQEPVAVGGGQAPTTGLSGVTPGHITYLHGDIAALGLAGFDLVTALEVVEHVADKGAFIGALAAALAPGGLMVLSVPNRTAASRLLLVEGAERIGAIPRGTHDWNSFVTPEEMAALLDDAGLAMGEPRGIAWSPMQGLHLSQDLALNYIVTATRA